MIVDAEARGSLALSSVAVMSGSPLRVRSYGQRGRRTRPEFHFGAGGGAAPDLERARRCVRARSRMPVMPQCPSLPGPHDLRVDAAAVVAHQDAQTPWRRIRARARSCVAPEWRKALTSAFAADPVDLVADRSASAVAGCPSTMTRYAPRRPTRQLPAGTPANACSRSSGAVPATRRPRTALRPSSITRRIRSSTRPSDGPAPASPPAARSAATCSCIDALTKPCSSVSCSSCAMRVRSASRSSKRSVEPPRHLADAEPVAAPSRPATAASDDRQPEPRGLPQQRLDLEGQRRLRCRSRRRRCSTRSRGTDTGRARGWCRPPGGPPPGRSSRRSKPSSR